MYNHFLVSAGYFVPLVFWSTLALCGSRYDNYNHLSNMVSELGAAGSKTRVLFAVGLLLSSALSVVFVVGLVQELRELQMSIIPVLFILTFSFSIAGAAIFPLPHRLHGLLGSPSIALSLSPGLASILWRQETSLIGIFPISMVSMLTMLLGLLVFFPHLLSKYVGLKQRFFHIGWSFWFVYLCIVFN